MATAEEPAGKTCTWYAAFCPRGGDCKKGGKRLGTFRSEAQARQAMISHLMGSTYHLMSKTEAQSLADAADVDTEDYDENWRDDASWPSTSAPAGPSPSTPTQALANKAAFPQRPIGQPPASSASFDQMVKKIKLEGQGYVNVAVLYASATKSEQAARASARIARQAAAAFDAEAEVFGAAVSELRQIMNRGV